MSVKDIAKLGRMLAQFLANFACCFARCEGRALLSVYVRGLLSDVQRKNAEAIALEQKIAPRTLQRFLESIVWDEQKLRDRCQQMIATEHASSDAIGCIDETGTAKSGKQTTGVKRQYNGNRGKVENCVFSPGVHLARGIEKQMWSGRAVAGKMERSDVLIKPENAEPYRGS